MELHRPIRRADRGQVRATRRPRKPRRRARSSNSLGVISKAANLRGTDYAAMHTTHHLRAKDHGTSRLAEIDVTGLASSCSPGAAAHSRRTPERLVRHRVLAGNNQNGDAMAAAAQVREVFGDPTGTICTQQQDLQANYADSSTQGLRPTWTRSHWTIPRSTRAPQPRTRSCWRGRSPTGCSAFDAVDGHWPSSAVENLGRGVERLESGVESPSIDRHLERRSGMDSVLTPAT